MRTGAQERLGRGEALSWLAVRELCRGARSEEDMSEVLDLVLRNRSQLAVRRKFGALNRNVGAALMRACGDAGAHGLLPRILRERQELGVTFSDRALRRALDAAAGAGEGLAVARAFRAFTEDGAEVSPRLGYSFVRASLDSGRKDLAEAIAKECTDNGVALPPATRRLLDSKESAPNAAGADGDKEGGGGEGSSEEVSEGKD